MSTNTVLSQSKFNVYGAITQKIVAAIKEAMGTYRMPWHSSGSPIQMPANAATAHSYQGVNVLSLWIDALAKGFGTGHWATYKQWQSLGTQVRHGERGSLIIFYKTLDQTELEREAGEAQRHVGKASWVFNAAQVENWQPPELPQTSSVEIDKDVAAFVEATEARITHGHQMARYRRDIDCIEMPNVAWFRDTRTSTATQGYHSVLLHELTHYAAFRIMPRRHGIGSDERAYETFLSA